MNPEIEKLIQTYQPNDKGMKLLHATKVVLLVGITGAGKNSILAEMMKTGEFHDMVTSVTREPRENNGVMEIDGIDYHFLTESQAVEKIRQGEYVEVSPVHERIYGVTTSEIEKAAVAGKTAVADITVLGVEKYKKLSDNIIAIFLLPPDYKTWHERVQKRYVSKEEFEADWPNRRRSAIAELTKALQVPYYHFVINDDLEEAVVACLKIAHSDDNFHRKDDEKRLVARELLEEIKKHAN